jgi:hypothetical protein
LMAICHQTIQILRSQQNDWLIRRHARLIASGGVPLAARPLTSDVTHSFNRNRKLLGHIPIEDN